MKGFALFLSSLCLLGLTSESWADDQIVDDGIRPFACLPNEHYKPPKFSTDELKPRPTEICDDEKQATADSGAAEILVGQGDMLVLALIRYPGKATADVVKWQDAKPEITFEILNSLDDGTTAESRKLIHVGLVEKSLDQYTYGLVLGPEFGSLEHGTKVTIRFRYGRNSEYSRYRYFRIKKAWSPYGVANSKSVFWFPVGLFSTRRGYQTNSGLLLASMPIGLAAGSRYYFTKQYVGGSLIGNWLVYPGQEVSSSKKTYVLESLTVGGLLDFSNVAYLGWVYGVDLRKGATNPGGFLVFGIGPSALQFFKSEEFK